MQRRMEFYKKERVINMEKVLLGMSGGVDSSVAAILLQKEGYEVVGCTMKLCEPEEKNEKVIEEAKKVCDKLGIKHYVFDYKKEFKTNVIENFIKEYEKARTPNPCVECNKYLKFGLLYEKAVELGCKYIATGHYAKVEFSEKYNQYVLRKSDEENKDQTYFLYTISKEKIKNIIFPLQSLKEKSDTRKIAEAAGLEIATKKDSQEICFIPNDDYKEFLSSYIKSKQGNIVLKNGEILGKHNGIINYTIGQRKGLGISYKEPLYVVEINKEKNEVVVGIEKELYTSELYAENLNWLMFDKLEEEIECSAKVRYRAKPAKAKIIPLENKIKVEFEEPQRAITKGQSVVFYIDDILLGGGKII